MASQAAEQIIAGVVLSERLAVTMYGAIHRAQFSGQRNLRGLVVDPKMLAESSFRIALTEATAISTATELAHASIVPTVAVEEGGPDVVVVTRGVGRYVTVQDPDQRGAREPRPGRQARAPGRRRDRAQRGRGPRDRARKRTSCTGPSIRGACWSTRTARCGSATSWWAAR